jgi:hypothetical protein
LNIDNPDFKLSCRLVLSCLVLSCLGKHRQDTVDDVDGHDL